jgi:hypothetical protein
MGDRREQMTIVGPDFRLARPRERSRCEWRRRLARERRRGERISMAVLRNSDSVTDISEFRFIIRMLQEHLAAHPPVSPQ